MKAMEKLTDKENAAIYKDTLNYLIKELRTLKRAYHESMVDDNAGNEKLSEEDREFLRGIDASKELLQTFLAEAKSRTFDKTGKYIYNK